MTSDDRLEELGQLLAMVTDEGDGMLLSEFDGLCTALVIGPDMVMPSEWLNLVWGGDGVPEFKNEEQMQRLFDLLMGHYNEVARLLTGPSVTFSPVYDYDEDTVYWEPWVSGFERAMRLRADAWKSIYDATEGTDAEDVGQSILLILELAAQTEGNGRLTEEQIAAITEDVPELIADIVFKIQHWMSAEHQPVPFPSMAAANMPTPPSSRRKVGRNDPCPCGSGRKYKKCCGAH